MSEWVSVLAVFWILWLADGARLGPGRVFTAIIRGRPGRGRACGSRRARIGYDRLSLPGWLPGSVRVTMPDVPLALSPTGFCNRPSGAAGRPTETVTPVRAWRWEEVREIGVAKGWVYVNGMRCCPNTQHVRASELLALAQMSGPARERRIRAILTRWFRPAHLQRRAEVLARRTALPAALNAAVLTILVLATIYLAADVAARIPERAGNAIVALAPALALMVFAAHVTAVIATWRGVKRLKAVALEKRGSALFTALMLPAQALRLRAVAAEGFFPAQHPLAVVAAFGRPRAKAVWFFNALADLRWPLAGEGETELSRDVVAWFAGELEPRVMALARASGVDVVGLFAAPERDGRESCAYCPRCRDQFVVGRERCPQGVPLQPLGGVASAKAR